MIYGVRRKFSYSTRLNIWKKNRKRENGNRINLIMIEEICTYMKRHSLVFRTEKKDRLTPAHQSRAADLSSFFFWEKNKNKNMKHKIEPYNCSLISQQAQKTLTLSHINICLSNIDFKFIMFIWHCTWEYHSRRRHEFCPWLSNSNETQLNT